MLISLKAKITQSELDASKAQIVSLKSLNVGILNDIDLLKVSIHDRDEQLEDKNRHIEALQLKLTCLEVVFHHNVNHKCIPHIFPNIKESQLNFDETNTKLVIENLQVEIYLFLNSFSNFSILG
jgi:hypothetical protein